MRRAWLLGVIALAGCGGAEKPATDPQAAGTPREQVAAAVHDYLDALADADGPRACGHLTRLAQDDLTTMTNAPSCEEAVGALDHQLDDQTRRRLRSARITVGSVTGRTAAAKLASGTTTVPRTVPLEKDGGEWKISGFEGERPGSSLEAQCTAGAMAAFDDGNVPKFWVREGRKDYGDYAVELCRRADAAGLLDQDPKTAERKLAPIARRIVREMVRRGQIKAP